MPVLSRMGSRALGEVTSLSSMVTELITTNSTYQSQFEIVGVHVVTDYLLCTSANNQTVEWCKLQKQKLLAFQY